jgi:hypothetical protein
MHDQELLGIQERLSSLIKDIYGTSGLMGRVEKLEKSDDNLIGHAGKIEEKKVEDNQESLLEPKSLPKLEVTIEATLLEAMNVNQLKEILGGTGRDLIVANDLMRLSRLDGENQQLRLSVNRLEDEISRVKKGNPIVARLNFSALVARLTSLSSMLVDIYTGDEKKKKMKKRMEHLSSAIRLLVNDIQFPLKDKDIFMRNETEKYFVEREPSTVDFDYPDYNDYDDEEY